MLPCLEKQKQKKKTQSLLLILKGSREPYVHWELGEGWIRSPGADFLLLWRTEKEQNRNQETF